MTTANRQRRARPAAARPKALEEPIQLPTPSRVVVAQLSVGEFGQLKARQEIASRLAQQAKDLAFAARTVDEQVRTYLLERIVARGLPAAGVYESDAEGNVWGASQAREEATGS